MTLKPKQFLAAQNKQENVAKDSKSGGNSIYQKMANTNNQTIQKKNWQDVANTSPQVTQLQEYQQMANSGQETSESTNQGGLPSQLKDGIENMSGFDMSDVNVHYNSNQPAQLQAHAYAQGNDIHVAPGQEQHLPHEAWHIVQQKQGRVQTTKQFKGKVNVNDDAGLEKEADIMGAKAASNSQNKNIQAKNKGQETNGAFQLKKEGVVPKQDAAAFNAGQQKKIKKAMVTAYKMTTKAIAKVTKKNGRYKRFFDAGKVDSENADARVTHVKAGFTKVQAHLKDETTNFKKWDLPDDHKFKIENTYAYVDSDEVDPNIYMGGMFWASKNGGYDSRAGTIIHELTHKLHGTKDHHYGLSKSKKSAKLTPSLATTNADNY